MARKKEFDTEYVLDKAAELFWKNGYSNTSVQDLVDSLGLGKGSIYNAFKNKHKLFLATLDRYADRSNSLFQGILNEASTKEAFRKLFLFLIDEIINDDEQRGCFIINATTELAAIDPDVAERINLNQKRQITCFSNALQTAKENGDISPDLDPEALALFLSNTMKGIRVMAKMNPSREDLEKIVNTALKILD